MLVSPAQRPLGSLAVARPFVCFGELDWPIRRRRRRRRRKREKVTLLCSTMGRALFRECLYRMHLNGGPRIGLSITLWNKGRRRTPIICAIHHARHSFTPFAAAAAAAGDSAKSPWRDVPRIASLCLWMKRSGIFRWKASNIQVYYS